MASFLCPAAVVSTRGTCKNKTRRRQYTHVRSLQKLVVPKRLDASLTVPGIHRLQLLDRVLPHRRLDRVDNVLMRLQVRAVRLQPNHSQRGRRLQRSVDVIVLAPFGGLVQIRRLAPVWVGLRLQQVGVWASPSA